MRWLIFGAGIGGFWSVSLASIAAGIFWSARYNLWQPIVLGCLGWAVIWTASYYFWDLRARAPYLRTAAEQLSAPSPVLAAVTAKWLISLVVSLLAAGLFKALW